MPSVLELLSGSIDENTVHQMAKQLGADDQATEQALSAAMPMLLGALGLALINTDAPHALTWVWVATNVWIGVRAFFGVVRIWPGIGRSPFRGFPSPVSLNPSS